jgi:predicted kinase
MSAHMLVDIVEDAMLRAGLEPGWSTGVAAYEAVGAAAQQNLALGRVVIVDAVNDSDAARQTWRDAPRGAEVEVRFVLLRPPAGAEHQRRLDARTRGFGHWSHRGNRSWLGLKRMRPGRMSRSSCQVRSA